ncbi:unnamed protein product [Urochloa humidicola]
MSRRLSSLQIRRESPSPNLPLLTHLLSFLMMPDTAPAIATAKLSAVGPVISRSVSDGRRGASLEMHLVIPLGMHLVILLKKVQG